MPAPVVRGTARPASPANRPAAAAPIPFTRAARKKSALSVTTPVQALGPAAVAVGPIEVPAAGYLRYLELQVTIASAGNAANVTFSADGPWNVISYVSLSNAAGDTIIVPITGYQLFLINKYGAMAEDPPFCDPRLDPNFTAVTGAGGTGGSSTFSLRVPLELDPKDAFCAVPNMAANKSYQLQLMFNPIATVYGTAPTVAPTVQVTALAYYWSQPNATNGLGTPQEVAPRGVGSVSMWRLQTIPVTQGDKILQLTNVGNVIRQLIFVLRTGPGVRTNADWPATSQLILNNDPLFYLPNTIWQSDIATSYGYTAAAKDVANGLDTGVYPVHYFLEQKGRVGCDTPRDQWLPTLDATLLQLRGTSFGAAAGTLEVLTNEVKPVSAAALYGNGY